MNIISSKVKSKGGLSKDRELSETIEKFEYNGIDYLYDVEPQSNNLFMVGNFTEHNLGGGSAIKEFFNAQYRIRSIKLPDFTLSIDSDELTRIPVFKEGNMNYEVTIDWFEDVYHSVRQYHQNWVDRWYNPQYGVLRCGYSGKFRQLDIVAYHYKNKNTGSINDLTSRPEVEPLFVVHLGGMVPLSVPGIQFSYDQDGAETNYSTTYKVGKFTISYFNDFTSTENSMYASSKEAKDASEKLWNPEGITSEIAGEVDDGEKIRVARAISTRYDTTSVV